MPIISGIQQIGVGVANVEEAANWYKTYLGMSTMVFEDSAEANLMLPYTGGKPHKRRAILALNINGGGGLEIWQYTSRTPVAAKQKINLGDLGIFAIKIKAHNVKKVYDFFKQNNINIVTELAKNPAGKPHFYFTDPYNNVFEIIESTHWFGKQNKNLTGGVAGAVIGVKNLEESLNFYEKVLGYNKVLFNNEQEFDDLKGLNGSDTKMKRALLTHKNARIGRFSNLLGATNIELIETPNESTKIFENRFWGDLGFIHMCFDITGMEKLSKHCTDHGHPFTVDSSNSFEMGVAAGHFSYIEDPSGTLIEFVETHKVPIMKKIGWYLNLKNRDPKKPLPNWMLKTMRLSKIPY